MKKQIQETTNNDNSASLSLPQQEFVKNLFSELFNKDGNGIGQSDADKLETIKLVLASFLNDKHIHSLTNISPDELEDINDAYLINEYADNPQLTKYLDDRLKLSRSRIELKDSSNLLKLLSDLSHNSGFNFGEANDRKDILGRFRH